MISTKKSITSLTCDLQIATDKPHSSGSTPLKWDPLERTREIFLDNGSKETQILQVCRQCYRKAFADKQSLNGKICDLQTDTGTPHSLRSHPLVSDPQRRIKEITNADGSKGERVLKLCHNCYTKSLADKQSLSGMTCDLQTATDIPHSLELTPLISDPQKRKKKITNANGAIEEKVLQVCRKCYRKALADKSNQNNNVCDLQTDTIRSIPVRSNSLKKPKRKAKEMGNFSLNEKNLKCLVGGSQQSAAAPDLTEMGVLKEGVDNLWNAWDPQFSIGESVYTTDTTNFPSITEEELEEFF